MIGNPFKNDQNGQKRSKILKILKKNQKYQKKIKFRDNLIKKMYF